MDRRRFLVSTGTLAAGLTAACGALRGAQVARPGTSRGALAEGLPGEPPPLDPESWASVRQQFAIAERPIDLSAMLLASHPWPVRRAIEEHRRGLDLEPTLYHDRNDNRL
ncbi:MAG TPA: hypothetical protein VJP59_07580, partial [Gemmatimonadota bacterium]|nr:hypothetical protein [Gemmatimonadota bacterium]